MNKSRIPTCLLTTTMTFSLACFSPSLLGTSSARAADPAPQELLRGPIHEAFAQPIVFDPKPGIIVDKKPPELIDEKVPDQKPEGDNVVWIPGYWSYDKEQEEFIWVSGIWRAVPPDQTWVPGYWRDRKKDTFQWVPGFWSEGNATEYLPKPPDSLESGPPNRATATEKINADEVIWAPGVWVWQNNKYFWRPGLWVEAKKDWIWTPAQYVWSPSGYVFVDGYWDHPIQQRGLLFAPAQFAKGFAPSAKTVYAPSVVIDTGTISTNMFVNPAHHHYYFGDYYDAKFPASGIYPVSSFHGSSLGYDPFHAHDAWLNRKNPNWSNEQKDHYFARRNDPALRPLHTFKALQEHARGPNVSKDRVGAHTLGELSRSKNSSVQLHRVEESHLKDHHQFAMDSNHLKSERAKFEAKNPPRKEGAKAGASHKFEHPKAKLNPTAPKAKKAIPPPKKPVQPPHKETPPKHEPLPHPTDHIKNHPANKPKKK